MQKNSITRASCRNTLNHIVCTIYCIEVWAMIYYIVITCRLALFLQEAHNIKNIVVDARKRQKASNRYVVSFATKQQKVS